jgi:hypothetical protein
MDDRVSSWLIFRVVCCSSDVMLVYKILVHYIAGTKNRNVRTVAVLLWVRNRTSLEVLSPLKD